MKTRNHKRPFFSQSEKITRNKWKFISNLMKGGARQKAERILESCLGLTAFCFEAPFLDQAVCNVQPLIELRPKGFRRKPKAVPITTNRAEKLAIQ